jgi:RNA polymerase sigma factor (sigma-70 family)
MSTNNFTTDYSECWSRFLAGDRWALDTIVREHFNLLYNYGRKFTHDAALVKDCIQDLFLTLWKNRENLGYTSSVRNYLMKSLRRRLERAIPQQTIYNSENIEFLSFNPLEESPVFTAMEAEENQTTLNKKIVEALTTLSKRQQEIIYLRFYLEADATEIAQIMGLNKQSVYNLQQQAIARLREVTDTLFQPNSVAFSALLLFVSMP